MWKLIGYTAFFIAVGMLFMLLLSNRLLGIFIIALLLLISYNLFFACK